MTVFTFDAGAVSLAMRLLLLCVRYRLPEWSSIGRPDAGVCNCPRQAFRNDVHVHGAVVVKNLAVRMLSARETD
jgi:hypothetical protein